MADGWDMGPGDSGAVVPNRTCYAYVDVTHEYVCPVVADIDPLEPEKVLWPRNSTQVIPPAYTAGKNIPVFDEGTQKWSLLPDFRGKFGYTEDGTPVMITKAGNPSTFDPPLSPNPPPVPPIEIDPNIAARTSKVEFWRRATDEEATGFLADLTDASPRLRALFDAVTYLTPGTPEYPALRAAIVARVGEDRANELLAPSND